MTDPKVHEVGHDLDQIGNIEDVHSDLDLAIGVVVNSDNIPRRDFGVCGTEFAGAMADFGSLDVYYKVGHKFEYFSATLSETTTFLEACLLFVLHLYSEKTPTVPNVSKTHRLDLQQQF